MEDFFNMGNVNIATIKKKKKIQTNSLQEHTAC